MTSDPTTRIEQHLTTTSAAITAELATITDPIQRQATARTVLEHLLPKLSHDVKTVRARAVAELKEGRTLAQVGELLDGMSTARVDQILKDR